jgi:hypothetical protein
MALTVAYADAAPMVTAEVMQTAVEELQWTPYAKRVKKRRAPGLSGVDPAMQTALRDYSHALGRISGQLERLDDLSPALVSITSSLAAIELYLRQLTQARRQDEPEPFADRRRRNSS